MPLNLKNCDQQCYNCIKKYKSKHSLKKGEKFEINCTGILSQEYINLVLQDLAPTDKETALSLMDPVEWAKNNIDWHCLDPEGSVWKRKNPGEYYEWEAKNPDKSILGKSRYHRPYQAAILRCQSKRQVLRLGRQLGKSEAIVVKCLYNLFVKPGCGENEGFKAIIITPFSSQVDLLYGRMISLIESSDILKNSIKRKVKTPYASIELHNGSVVKFFTAGSKSGGNADSVRGQSGHMLLFDEADYLNAEDMDSALSIVTNFPNASVYMSSTPTGRREKFYNACNDRLFKEFYFPSTANPMWNEDMEKFFRSQLSAAGFTHEVMCLAKDTEVLTTNGNVAIQDIKAHHILFDSDMNPISIVNPSKLTGVKDIIETELENGEIVKTTYNHKFPDKTFQKTELIDLNQLPVYFVNSYNKSNEEIIYARLVGYNLGDGTINSTRFQGSFYSKEYDDMEKLREDILHLYPSYKGKVAVDIVKGNENRLVKVDSQRCAINVSSNITKKLLSLGCVRGKKVYQEFTIPEFVKNSSDLDVKKEFLAALFGAEGSTPRTYKGYSAHTITLSMDKKIGVEGSQFFQELVDLLEEFNIKSTWTSRITGYNRTYTLLIYNDIENIINFFTKIGYRYSKQKEQLAFYWIHYLQSLKRFISSKIQLFNNARSLYKNGKKFSEIVQHTGLTRSQVGKAIYNNRNPKRVYKEFPKFNSWLTDRLYDNTLWLSILNKKILPKEEVYNITVNSKDHSYLLSNGIRTFNCDFGQEEEGVFQHQFIKAAKTEYEYGDYTYNKDWLYAIGVDWNDTKVGTTVVVVGFNPTVAKYFVVERHIVQREGWTQKAAMDKIVELNRKWHPHPAFIYVDKGFGGAQYEILRDFGNQAITHPEKGKHHPDANLRYLKQYDFGGALEVKDIWTGQPVKKESKPFLVENAQRRFEANEICFPESDDVIEKQLYNYIVDRITQSGRPVYKARTESIGDHTLDALMLAFVAFTLEATPLGKREHSTRISFSGNFGEKKNKTETLPGTVVIDPRFKEKQEAENKKNKPSMDRGEIFVEQDKMMIKKTEVPANHTTLTKPEKLWSWPGFGHDKPKPVSARSGKAKRPTRPSRKNI